MPFPRDGFDESLHPRHVDGKWAPKNLGENPEGVSADLDHVAGIDSVPDIDLDEIASATPGELWDVVDHPDWRVRMYAPASPNLTTAQMQALADPQSQPVPVRLAVSALSSPGVAARAAADPNPLVRQRALHFGWDLDPDTVDALRRDPEIARVEALLPVGAL